MNFLEYVNKDSEGWVFIDKIRNVIKELCEYFQITIHYSNSNIYPKEEYDRRLNELKVFINQFNNFIKFFIHFISPFLRYKALFLLK